MLLVEFWLFLFLCSQEAVFLGCLGENPVEIRLPEGLYQELERIHTKGLWHIFRAAGYENKQGKASPDGLLAFPEPGPKFLCHRYAVHAIHGNIQEQDIRPSPCPVNGLQQRLAGREFFNLAFHALPLHQAADAAPPRLFIITDCYIQFAHLAYLLYRQVLAKTF